MTNQTIIPQIMEMEEAPQTRNIGTFSKMTKVREVPQGIGIGEIPQIMELDEIPLRRETKTVSLQ